MVERMEQIWTKTAKQKQRPVTQSPHKLVRLRERVTAPTIAVNA